MRLKWWGKKSAEEHSAVKDKHLARGEGSQEAEASATATLNKEQARTGQADPTPEQSPLDDKQGKPGGSLDAKSKAELYTLATQRGIEGRSSMTKAQLIDALSES